MKQMFSQLKTAFSRDRLFVTTCIFLLLTVVSAFLGSAILSITVPLVGALFPFRIFLPITLILYLIWALKGNDHLWRDSSALEKWAFVLIGVMAVYGAVSLLRAANFLFTFKRLFNLCLDLAFFFLLLRLCRHKNVLKAVMVTAMAGFVFLSGLGIYEVFHEGVFHDMYDDFHRGSWFMEYLQPPVVTSANTNDYVSSLIFVAAAFLTARARGVFDKNNRLVKYAPVAIFPVLFFLVTIADARLNLIAFWVLLAITVIHDLLTRFSKKRTFALTAFLLCCITFCHQYRYVMPPIQSFAAQAKAYCEYQVALGRYYFQYGFGSADDGTIPPRPTMPEAEPIKPAPDSGNQDDGSLRDEFFESGENGEIILNTANSGGIRTSLLIHAGKCFLESYGLGVGLGNTEVLAAQRSVIPKWAHNEANSIHCFLARIVADYGIFVLIPLGAIVFLLLRGIWRMFVAAYKTKNNTTAANVIQLFGCCALFPIVSTASSDAQDILPMWLFLALLILLSETLYQKVRPANQ